MKKRAFLSIVIVALAAGVISGQNPGQNLPRQNPARQNLQNQNPNRERLDAYRIAFFTQRMGLTSKEAEKFWPVYNDFQERRNKILSERAEMTRLFNQNAASMSDRELSELGDKYISLETVETELNLQFYQNMKEILPPAKIFRYYQAENQYKLLLLKELQERRQERLNPGQR